MSELKCWLPCCAGAGSKSALKVKVQDGPELYVCRLSEGRQDFANLDLVLDEYTEFTVEGAALHITGAPAWRMYVAMHTMWRAAFVSPPAGWLLPSPLQLLRSQLAHKLLYICSKGGTAAKLACQQ